MEDPPEHYGAKKIALDNLFVFLIILWKYDEWKKKSVFPCAALSGCFFGSADCDLNSFLSEWTAGMRLYWQYVSGTYFIPSKIIYFELIYDVATD